MAANAGLSQAQVIEALQESYGIISRAARTLRCHPNAIRYHVNHYPEVREALEAERERLVDLAEEGLLAKLHEGDTWAIGKVLGTLGRARGYADRVEHTGPDGGVIEVRAVDYRQAIAPLEPAPAAPGPVGDRETPG